MVGRQQWRLLADTVILGFFGALSAQLFLFLLRLTERFFLTTLADYTPPGLPSEGYALHPLVGSHGLWLIPVATTLGGFLSGMLVYSLTPEVEGHSTGIVIRAFHRASGYIKPRVPPVKMIASAVTIGSGGSAGREGPVGFITAGLASIYATLAHRSESERRLLLLVGMASGLAAIFRSPIGTAFFAIEVLYSGMEFETGALVYALLGSLVAYAVNALFAGFEPVFQVPRGLPIPGFSEYLWFVLLGILAGLVATLLPAAIFRIRDGFHALPIPRQIKPALGGLGVGLLAVVGLPEVLGGGYGTIQLAIDGRLAADLLLILVFAKILALALTLSSGGSGGAFVPNLFVGAVLGGFLAKVFHLPSATFAVVGMAAVFGAAARIPIATLLLVTEMTGGYTLLVPAALAVTVSYLIQVELSRTLKLKYTTIYEAQVPGPADSPAHQLEHLDRIMTLLSEQEITLPEQIDHLNLEKLLLSGIPIDISENRQFVLGVLREDSPYVGKPVQSSFPPDARIDLVIVAILRRGRLLFPESVLKLEPGDHLLAIASPEGRVILARRLAPPS